MGARKALQPTVAWGGAWPKAAALLTRQALEETVAAVWPDQLLSMRSANMTAQLISLPFFLADPDLGRRIRQCWHALSNVCHAHPYELAPTVAELTGWLEVVDQLIAATGP